MAKITQWTFNSDSCLFPPLQQTSLYQKCARPLSSSLFLLTSQWSCRRSRTSFPDSLLNAMRPLVGIPFVIQVAHCYCKNSTKHWLAVVFSSVFRICWTIFFVMGLAAIIIGGFVVICAGPLTNHKLYKVGGALQLLGGKAKYRIGGFFSNRSSEAFFRRRLSLEHFTVCREISAPQKGEIV